MPAFDRYGMWLGSTWAYRRFKLHHTEINDLYWSFAPVAGYADYLARHATPAATPTTLFFATGPDARRLAPSVGKWQQDLKEFQNWVRLASLLSVVSYFEIYMRDAITIALRSDPLARFGRPKMMDGVTWLKEGLRDHVEPLIRDCLMREWPKRIRAYRTLFGSVPSEITGNVPALENIRSVRNSVGHTFGRNPVSTRGDILRVGVTASQRLAEARFKRWLGLIDELAGAIDRHLGPKHIGEFETLLLYHHWKDEPRIGRAKSFTEQRAFSRKLHDISGSTPGTEFSRLLIRHYNRA
ncbi:MAG TPA: hypothetical protein VGI28_16525 [Stellaceae bacterium]|jgi:hypothetical protein